MIVDSNLRLALIDEVHRRRHPSPWPAAIQPLPDTDDEPLPELEAVLRALPLAPADLASLQRLTLDGDRDAYACCYPYWWDLEPDHFVIHDVAGIDACTSLVYLSLGQGVVEGTSLAPLATMRALETLALCTTGKHRDLDALLSIPSLRRVEVFNLASSRDPAWASTVAALRARGVDAGPP
jgi:hypothetical protein